MNRLLIVARDAAEADVVRRVLRHAPSCRIIGWTGAQTSHLEDVLRAKPDVTVIDDGVGLEAALAMAGRLRAALPGAKILLLAGAVSPDLAERAQRAGADAVIAKTASPPAIGTLVREIAAGHVFCAAPAGRTAPARLPITTNGSGAAELLTTRELEILRHVAAGRSNSVIAAELCVTEQTVKFHLSNVYRKLKLSNRTQAAHYAYTHDLFPGGAETLRLTAA